jgi:hypothetical protein
MIPWDEFVKEGSSLGLDEQIAINHTNCEAGTDTRSRLYIKRVGENLLVAYCHNCSDKGIYVDGYSNVNSYRKVDNGSPTDGRVIVTNWSPPKLPPDLDFEPSLWPYEARKWVQKFSLRFKLATRMAMGYSPSRERLIIPFYSVGAGYEGYLSRKECTF